MEQKGKLTEEEQIVIRNYRVFYERREFAEKFLKGIDRDQIAKLPGVAAVEVHRHEMTKEPRLRLFHLEVRHAYVSPELPKGLDPKILTKVEECGGVPTFGVEKLETELQKVMDIYEAPLWDVVAGKQVHQWRWMVSYPSVLGVRDFWWEEDDDPRNSKDRGEQPWIDIKMPPQLQAVFAMTAERVNRHIGQNWVLLTLFHDSEFRGVELWKRGENGHIYEPIVVVEDY